MANNSLALIGPTLDEIATRDPMTSEALWQILLGQFTQQQQLNKTQQSAGVIGGAQILTSDFSATDNENGSLLVFNSANERTLTLPAKPPSASWKVFAKNVGSRPVTIAPNGKMLNGQAGSATIAPGASLYIATDGENYFST